MITKNEVVQIRKLGDIVSRNCELPVDKVMELCDFALKAIEALEDISKSKPGGQHNDGPGHIAMIDMVIIPTAKEVLKLVRDE